jgi:AdoMet-dependent rRNA methyltransferase SPB1
MLLTKTNKKEKKPRALGYDDDTLTLYHELKVSDFLNSSDYLLKLSKTSSIILDDEKIANSPHTTDEIRECIQDIKVCGPRELRNILAWRKKLLADINKEKKAATSTNENVVEIEEDPEEAERREFEEIDQQISVAKADEKTKLKKKKKKMLKEKAKVQQRKQLNMIHEEDGGMVPEDLELFSLKNLQKMLERQQNRTKLANEKEENLEELQYPSGDEEENMEDEGVWETRKDDDDESDEKGDERYAIFT